MSVPLPEEPDVALTAVLQVIENPKCECEFVDIGIGMQKVSESPECPRCTAYGLACAVSTALADAGLLIPAGGKACQGYRVTYRDSHGQPVVWSTGTNPDSASKDLAAAKHQGWPDAVLETRTVIATSWTEVTS